MFEIGKKYDLFFKDSSGKEHSVTNCIVNDFDEVNGLLKVSQFSKQIIFMIRNTTFYRAEEH